MLLGIYGVFALGKSTFVKDRMDAWSNVAVAENFNVVVADQCEEFHYERDEDCWILVKDDTGKWNGKKEQKIPPIAAMIADHDTLWVVESARYFGGLHEEFISAYKEARGGLRFIIPWTDEPTGRKFLIDRCEKRNKTFRADYWDEKRLIYEVKSRYVNVMNSRYIPAHILCVDLFIGYKRKEWATVDSIITTWIKENEYMWYPNENSAGKGKQRIRQDHHRQAITSAI